MATIGWSGVMTSYSYFLHYSQPTYLCDLPGGPLETAEVINLAPSCVLIQQYIIKYRRDIYIYLYLWIGFSFSVINTGCRSGHTFLGLQLRPRNIELDKRKWHCWREFMAKPWSLSLFGNRMSSGWEVTVEGLRSQGEGCKVFYISY